jgi:hypothetical protein
MYQLPFRVHDMYVCSNYEQPYILSEQVSNVCTWLQYVKCQVRSCLQ